MDKKEYTKEELLEKLKKGVEYWNGWRREKPDVEIDLSYIDFNIELRDTVLWDDLNNRLRLVAINLREADLSEADLEGVSLRYANLQGANLKGVGFQGAFLREANLKGAIMWRTNFSDTNVYNVEYDREGDYLGIRVATCYGSQAFKRHAQDQDFLAEFKEHHKYLHFIWWLFADCGGSFLRWAAWSLGIAIIFGFVYADYSSPNWLPEPYQYFFRVLNPEILLESSVRVPTFFTPYYFSIVTFTTLGFGDITPLNLVGEIWITIEVILGYIMLGGLISIFANKLARRSG